MLQSFGLLGWTGVAYAAAPVALPAEANAMVVVRTIVGLALLLVLSAAGGHPRVLQWEERLGLRQVAASGAAYFALGMIARIPSVGVLSDEVLDNLAPALRMGLGWIGFLLGYRFDARLFDRLPEGAGRAIVLRTVVPFVLVALVIGVVSFGVAPLQAGWSDPEFLRDALILGSAGAMTADTVVAGLARRGDTPKQAAARGETGDDRAGTLRRMIQVEELAGVLGLAVLAVMFRPPAATWALPPSGWALVTVGLGTVLGLLVYAVVRVPASGAASIVQLLGCVAFVAGCASALRLSPIVLCFLAGAVVANLPGYDRARVHQALLAVERPLYLVFLVVVGALWDWRDARGWTLLLAFVPARLLGKWLAGWLAGPGPLALSRAEQRMLAVAPMGALAVAIVVNAQVLFPDSTVPALVTAVILGAWVTEVLVQLGVRAREAVAW